MTSSPISKLNEQDGSTSSSVLLGLPDLAFAGKPGTGKTEAIAFLTRELGYTEFTRRDPPYAVECCCERAWWDYRARGFVIVRLVDPNASRRYSRLGAHAGPPAGWDLDDTDRPTLVADYTIENDGTKYDLYDEIVNVLVKERKKR